jgi:hypothetical protein
MGESGDPTLAGKAATNNSDLARVSDVQG